MIAEETRSSSNETRVSEPVCINELTLGERNSAPELTRDMGRNVSNSLPRLDGIQTANFIYLLLHSRT